jgi:hypothetical protein
MKSRLSRRPIQGQVGRSSPQVLEPAWRQFGVSDRALDRSMAEIALKGPGIGAPVGQHESAGEPLPRGMLTGAKV